MAETDGVEGKERTESSTVSSKPEAKQTKLPNKQIRHVCAGATAGAVSRTCVSPLERLKILLQACIVGHKLYCS